MLPNRKSSGLLVILAIATIAPLWGSQTTSPGSGYIETTFTMEDGLDSSIINAIAQAENGMLWVGTSEGLSMFDGHSFNRAFGALTTLLSDDGNGNLWAGTASGAARFGRARLERWSQGQPLVFHLDKNADQVESLLVTHDGTVWAAGRRTIYRFNGREFQPVIPEVSSNRIEESADGHLLIIGSQRFLEWDGRQLIEHPEIARRLAVNPDQIFHVVDDRSGGRWYATGKSLVRIQNGVVKRWLPHGVASCPVFRIYQDRGGGMWVSAGSRKSSGLYKVGATELEPVLVGRGCRAFLSDRDGDIWVGTNGNGLVRLKPRLIQVFSAADGLPDRPVSNVLTTHDGRLWTGSNCGGVSWYDGARFHILNEKNGLENSCVTTMAEADMWAARPRFVHSPIRTRRSIPRVLN